MPYKALHLDHYYNLPEIRKSAGCSCYFDSCHREEKGARELSVPFAFRKFPIRLQDCTESHDDCTRESDALVPLGLDHALTLHGYKRLEEREDLVRCLSDIGTQRSQRCITIVPEANSPVCRPRM